MFPVLFCALILLGIAYALYQRFDPIKSTEYKELKEELDFVTKQRDTLNDMLTEQKRINSQLEKKLNNSTKNED